MRLEHSSFGTRISTLLGLEARRRRPAAGHDRELAELRVTESVLRQALARNKTLLRQKDEAIRRQEVLTKECHHRLLNNLQMIAGLLSLQGQKEPNKEVAARLLVAANRVQSIARLHQHLHSMDDVPTVEFKAYLDELCRDHSTMSMSEQHPDRHIVVEAIELRLPTTLGIPLSLIVNELVTNAVKHGNSGPITVKLERQARGHALSVRNDGSALPEGLDPFACKRLGMTLVGALAKQIGGELWIDRGSKNDGTRFTVLFK